MSENNTSKVNKNVNDESLATWPGAFKIYGISKAAILRNRNLIIGIDILVGFLTLSYVVFSNHMANNLIDSILMYLAEFVLVVINYMTVNVMLEGLKGNKTNFDQTLSTIMSKALDIIICYIFISVISIISIVLLIVPAFFIIPRIYLAIYYVIDKNMDPITALKTCWNDTKGNVLKVYQILGVNILILLLALTIIGIPFAIYFGFYYYAAPVVYYRYISSNN